QVRRADQLAEPRGGLLVEALAVRPLELRLHILESVALDDLDRFDLGEVRGDHRLKTLAQRLQVRILAGVGELHARDAQVGSAGRMGTLMATVTATATARATARRVPPDLGWSFEPGAMWVIVDLAWADASFTGSIADVREI